MISVCIPAFPQYGHGVKHLSILLSSLLHQKGAFEVVVSDNSAENDFGIRDCCADFENRFPLRYFINPTIGISHNTNFAISKAKYDKIKPMYMDDVLLSSYALAEFSEALNRKHWAVSNSYKISANGHKLKEKNPYWGEKVLEGFNTVGMPSVVAFRKNDLIFDPNLKTLLDCEYYWLMMQKYGEPEWIRKPIIGQRYHENSTSSKQVNGRLGEFEYLKQKHSLI